MSDATQSLVLVCGADESFARPLAVTLYSALNSLEEGWSVELYVIDGGIRLKDKRRIERVLRRTKTAFTMHWTSIERERLSGLPVSGYINEAAYLRLFIPEVIPEIWNRAIYLDSDTIVERSLSVLWNEPFEGRALLATQGVGVPYVGHPRGVVNYEELGLDPEAPYFNSGVLVINLDRWRKEKIGQRVLECAIKHREFADLHDQYALNAVLAEDWKAVDTRWNMSYALHPLDSLPDSTLKEAVIQTNNEVFYNAFIYHYTGPVKPWSAESMHAARHRWIRYLWASGWYTPSEQTRARTALGCRRLWFHFRYRTRSARHYLAQQIPAVAHLLRR